jgi:hypothetical protein
MSEDWSEIMQDMAEGVRKRFPHISFDAIMELFNSSEIIRIPRKGTFIKRGQYDTRVAFVMKGLFGHSIKVNRASTPSGFGRRMTYLLRMQVSFPGSLPL